MTGQEEKDIELIEAYHRQELDDNEMKAFENRMFTDSQFARRVKEYTFIMDGLRIKGEKDFANNLREWEKQLGVNKKETKIIPIKRIMAIAATILVILIPLSYIIYNNVTSPIDNDELFAEYFNPYEDAISQRSGEKGALQFGMDAYNQGDYQQAVIFFEKVPLDDPQYISAECYSGIAYLALEKPEKAAYILKKVAMSKNGLFKEVAEWNLALAYLKNGNYNLLTHQLALIKNKPDHTFRKKAKELYDDIKYGLLRY